MGKKLHVGNLSTLVTDSDLAQLFRQHGSVESVKIVGQSSTGRSFGFVVMEHEVEAKAAIAALEGLDVEGQAITVHEARPRERRDPRARTSDFGIGRSAGSSGRFGSRPQSSVSEESS